MPALGNRRGPCYCNGDCPPETRPYLKYLVRTKLNTGPGTRYGDGTIYTIEKETPISKLCEWTPLNPLGGGSTEHLKKAIAVPGVGDHSYEWTLSLEFPPASFKQYKLVVTWDDGDEPFPAFLPPNCNSYEWILIGVLPPATIDLASLTAIPEWACTDAEAQAWVGRYRSAPW